MTENEDRRKMNINREHWDEVVPIHADSAFYGADAFRAGENKLNELERTEVGNVAGKSLLHLQCHFGLDTLSWARLGAKVAGMDYSEAGIRQARALAKECNIDAEFICCNLYDLPQHLTGQFDIVYTSYGVLCWLPDVKEWARIAARYVQPGGFFYIAEMHPFAMVFDDEGKSLVYRYPYFQDEPMRFDVQGSYVDRSLQLKSKEDYEWNHTLGEIVNELIEAGLRIEFLHEHPFTVYEQLPFLVTDGSGIWCFPEGAKPIPLMFSLKATKEWTTIQI